MRLPMKTRKWLKENSIHTEILLMRNEIIIFIYLYFLVIQEKHILLYNFSLFGPRIWMKHICPNTFGGKGNVNLFGYRSWVGTLFSIEEDDILLIRKHIVRLTSLQNWPSRFICNMMVHAISRRHWCLCLETLFFWMK